MSRSSSGKSHASFVFTNLSHFCRYYWFPRTAIFIFLTTRYIKYRIFSFSLLWSFFYHILHCLGLCKPDWIRCNQSCFFFQFFSSNGSTPPTDFYHTFILHYHMLNLNLKSDIPEVTFSKLPKTYLLGKWGRCRALFVSKMILTPGKKLYEWVWTSLADDWMRCLCIHIISLHNLCSLWGVSLWHRWVDDWRGRAGIDWWVRWEKPELGNYGLSREGSNL